LAWNGNNRPNPVYTWNQNGGKQTTVATFGPKDVEEDLEGVGCLQNAGR